VPMAESETLWRVSARPESRRCRWGAGFGHRACGAPAVAELNRGHLNDQMERRDSWWAYCADHLYGRWIEDGRVMAWRAEKVADAHPVEGGKR
jgi:hypothetical protein